MNSEDYMIAIELCEELILVLDELEDYKMVHQLQVKLINKHNKLKEAE